MTVVEASIMISNIFKWLFIIMIPVIAFILYILFNHPNLLFYDTLLFSIHFTSFYLIVYSVFLFEVLVFFQSNKNLLAILLFINLGLLLSYISLSLKQVFCNYGLVQY
jgi:hypothetical protein